MQNTTWRRLTAVTLAATCAVACGGAAPSATSKPTKTATRAPLALTSTERWRLPLPGKAVGLPFVDPDRIVVTTNDAVIGVNHEGGVEWTTPMHRPRVYAPRADGDLLFVAGYRSVAALRSATGERVWETEVVVEDEKPVRPVVSHDTVVVATSSGRVLGLHRATGAVRWTAAMPTQIAAAPAALDGVAVIVGRAAWAAFDVASGTSLWSGDLGLIGTSSPVVFAAPGGPIAAVASDEKLFAVGLRDGHLRWSAEAAQSEIEQVPIIGREGDLLVPDHWGRLTAYAPSDGRKLWAAAGDDGYALVGEPVELGRRLVALPLGVDGPRIASETTALALRPPANGVGVAGLGGTSVVVSTWDQERQNYLLAYDLDVGAGRPTR